MDIYFIRHGDTKKDGTLNIDGVADGALTDLGIKQAHLVGEYLSRISFMRVYSSDLKRAVETAKIIIEHQKGEKLELEIDKRIREIHMGVFHTSTEDQIKIDHPEFYREYMDRDSDFTYPGGESGEMVLRRTLSFFDEIKHEEAESICVVCHGGVIRSLFSHFLGLPQHKRFNLNPANAGASLLRIENGNIKVISINEISHLYQVETY